MFTYYLGHFVKIWGQRDQPDRLYPSPYGVDIEQTYTLNCMSDYTIKIQMNATKEKSRMQ
jgi:hypothetical protein